METFEAFEPTDAHLKLPAFRWKAIATTNYDVLVERAYDRSGDGAQALVPLVLVLCARPPDHEGP